jgi:uncharacterized HhH-GPD family protein
VTDPSRGKRSAIRGQFACGDRLGKQLGVTPPGWREACASFGEEGSLRSVADITGPETRIQVRDYKKALKAAAKA